MMVRLSLIFRPTLGMALLLFSSLTQAASVSDVVTKSLAFKAMLTTAQQATLQQTFTNTLAVKWSELPCGATCRNGIQFGTLTSTQLAAALEVVQASGGATPNEGYQEFQQARIADSILGVGGGNYGNGIYFLSYLNAPSITGNWMMQYGGHHNAQNISFNNGNVVGVTPSYTAFEPASFTAVGGVTYSPITQERTAMVNMLASLSPAQLSAAQLTGTFNDVVLTRGQDGRFPATKVGLQVGTLSSSQQALVMAAMDPWLNDADSASAAILRSVYQSEISGTYIAYAGGLALTAAGNYVRIDGPSVWIEFIAQTPNHYHTVWRDHKRDYGNYLANTSLALETPNRSIQKTGDIYFHLASSTNKIRLSLAEKAGSANIIIADMSGKTVMTKKNATGPLIEMNLSSLSKGNYLLHVEQGGKRLISSKFLNL